MFGTAGFWNSLRILINRRLWQLLEWRDIFTRMEADKTALKIPYGQMLERSARGKDRLFQEILEIIGDEMEENHEADVGFFWEKAFSLKSGELFITEEEKEILVSLARSLAAESSSTKTCEIYFFQLERQIRQVMDEKKEKFRLYGVAGILSGLFLVILLL